MSDLYRAILDRSSIRRYDPQPLDTALMERVKRIIAGVEPLVPENDFRVFHRPGMLIDKEFIRSMGAYGYIVSPPHALAPFTVGARFPLVDLGYRVEQIVVGLTQLGIGSCYIGTMGREDANRKRLNLPPDSRCGALLVFGYPASSLGGRTLNAFIRSVPKGDARLPEDQVFFVGSFDRPSEAPEDLKPLITAARFAPSAINTQPWLFLWSDPQLHVFVKRHNPKYGRGAGQDYRFYDGGISMANLWLARKTMSLKGSWLLPDQESYQIPDHPPSVQPLAALQLV